MDRADPELLGSAERLLELGGVNGRKPPRFAVDGASLFERPKFELFVSAGRLLLLGGLKDRFCAEEFWFIGVRLPKFSAPRFDEIPALGRCIELLPREANSEFERPAGTAPT